MLADDRYFDPEPSQKTIARELFALVRDLPIISPHGHVDPALFSQPQASFGNPVALLLQPDHYILRMLYSQGLSFEEILSKENPRGVWQLFAKHFHLFRGTPTGTWLDHTLQSVFGVQETLSAATAERIYEQIETALDRPEFSPRALFERFRIEVLATTDGATDALEHHQAIRRSNWKGRVIPTFRPDAVTNPAAPNWRENISALSLASGITIHDYASYITALEHRRGYFKDMGATAADTSPPCADSQRLTPMDAQAIFQRALQGKASLGEAARFSANMLFEMARMSAEDGLVLQIHPGSWRNHNRRVFEHYGADQGFDIPIAMEYTRSLLPLLEHFGDHQNLSLILFSLDESTYSRELAPLAGAYPTVKLGPPWWFHDSWNGMRRYFDQVMETAGIYNTAGFNDDTRAFVSIPARHDVWRRAAANWLAGLTVRGLINRSDAETMVVELAIGLAKNAYHL